MMVQVYFPSLIFGPSGLHLTAVIYVFFIQFVIYGSYFFIIGAVFLGRAVFFMTKVGWRRCWHQRYVQLENIPFPDVPNVPET